MHINVEKQPKSTIKLTITVPNEVVKKTYEQVLDKLIKDTEVQGFRKGMAPKEKVLEKTDINKLYGEVINELLQANYVQAIKEHQIAPVSNPRVEIKEFHLDKDFEFTAVVPVRPEVKVGDYRKALKEAHDKKDEEDKKLNADRLAKGETLADTHAHLTPNEVVGIINENSEVEIPDMLVEDETERMMARLVDQAGSIGLSLDQYLKAQNKTAEQLRSDYSKISEVSIRSEFVLGHLVQENKMEVTEEELEETVKASGNPDALEQLKNPVEKWYIKSALEKNKLINSLIEEVAHENEQGHEHE
ncbi:hypothetical protein A2976_01600 [candidate division WWE3 bacterium RIFCSPLOWO2_01_FULL_41_9]|uniref:Trigger factor n=1 Tax=candidate division WWE3 bacterium RIFCSPLOWO2_01_FULL_41_9 TaxID=1802626 RepID=A0A1F4VME1_UNCKA|nr:MAG: hypothetical protein A2976_01600 [candidate division WWE3 bacterium RIFCSPLOWO2_01_FULL_41_9]